MKIGNIFTDYFFSSKFKRNQEKKNLTFSPIPLSTYFIFSLLTLNKDTCNVWGSVHDGLEIVKRLS